MPSPPTTTGRPRRPVRATLLGARAAWRAPAIIARDLAAQLAPRDAAAVVADARDARMAVLVAHRMLALLARARPTRWRATCLYRSVAECDALRALGHPARVVIGVGNGAAPAETIAHAWVECEGVQCRSTRGAAELETLVARTA